MNVFLKWMIGHVEYSLAVIQIALPSLNIPLLNKKKVQYHDNNPLIYLTSVGMFSLVRCLIVIVRNMSSNHVIFDLFLKTKNVILGLSSCQRVIIRKKLT